MPLTSVNVVVLTWRETDLTVRCVDSAMESPLVRQVYVVDNEATGAVRQALHGRSKVVVAELAENTGFAHGVNHGIRQALSESDDYVLVINNDSTIDAESLALLSAALDDNPGLGMVGPSSWLPSGELLSTGGRISRLTWSVDEQSTRSKPDFLTWACVLLRASTLEHAGLLDERFFMYWEDVDFGLRLRDLGIDFAVVPAARLTHSVSASHSNAGSRILAYSAASFRYFLTRHGGMATSTGLIRLHLKHLKTLLSGDLVGARYVRAGWRIGRSPDDPVYRQMGALR